MATSALNPEQVLNDAAALAFAMLRFAEGAAHPEFGTRPPGVPRLGDEAYCFAPLSRRILLDEVPAFLAALPSPAFLWPTATRGLVALHLLSELSGERARSMEHELDNQHGAVIELAEQLGLDRTARILVEFDDVVHITSLAAMEMWSQRFCIYVGWMMAPLQGDGRASARMNLFRSDGARSVGTPGPPIRK